jgi:hypothetical protein
MDAPPQLYCLLLPVLPIVLLYCLHCSIADVPMPRRRDAAPMACAGRRSRFFNAGSSRRLSAADSAPRADVSHPHYIKTIQYKQTVLCKALKLMILYTFAQIARIFSRYLSERGALANWVA